jgi:hypothetical protein
MHFRRQSSEDPESERVVRHGWILPRAWTGQVRIGRPGEGCYLVRVVTYRSLPPAPPGRFEKK